MPGVTTIDSSLIMNEQCHVWGHSSSIDDGSISNTVEDVPVMRLSAPEDRKTAYGRSPLNGTGLKSKLQRRGGQSMRQGEFAPSRANGWEGLNDLRLR